MDGRAALFLAADSFKSLTARFSTATSPCPHKGGTRGAMPRARKATTMFRKVMLAGLMAATALGGIAPAYAQSWGERMRGRVEQPSGQAQGQARPGGDAQRGAGRERADRPATPRAERPAPGAQPPARQDRPAPNVRPAPQPRADSRWNGN